MKAKKSICLTFAASMLFSTISQAGCCLNFWSKPPVPVSKFAKLTSGLKAVNLKKAGAVTLGVAALAGLAYLLFRDNNWGWMDKLDLNDSEKESIKDDYKNEKTLKQPFDWFCEKYRIDKDTFDNDIEKNNKLIERIKKDIAKDKANIVKDKAKLDLLKKQVKNKEKKLKEIQGNVEGIQSVVAKMFKKPAPVNKPVPLKTSKTSVKKGGWFDWFKGKPQKRKLRRSLSFDEIKFKYLNLKKGKGNRFKVIDGEGEIIRRKRSNHKEVFEENIDKNKKKDPYKNMPKLEKIPKPIINDK